MRPPLIEPVRGGEADMTIAVFSSTVKLGGRGFVVPALSGRHPARHRLDSHSGRSTVSAA